MTLQLADEPMLTTLLRSNRNHDPIVTRFIQDLPESLHTDEQAKRNYLLTGVMTTSRIANKLRQWGYLPQYTDAIQTAFINNFANSVLTFPHSAPTPPSSLITNLTNLAHGIAQLTPDPACLADFNQLDKTLNHLQPPTTTGQPRLTYHYLTESRGIIDNIIHTSIAQTPTQDGKREANLFSPT